MERLKGTDDSTYDHKHDQEYYGNEYKNLVGWGTTNQNIDKIQSVWHTFKMLTFKNSNNFC